MYSSSSSSIQRSANGGGGGGAPQGSGSAMARETLRHVNNLSSTAAEIFTSPKNVAALQEGIRYRVYVQSGRKHIIGRQSDRELAIVMRSVLLQYGTNNDGMDSLQQVRALNEAVLEYCVGRVLTEVESYVRYRVDAGTNRVPMANAVPASIKGTGERSLQYGTAHFL